MGLLKVAIALHVLGHLHDRRTKRQRKKDKRMGFEDPTAVFI